MSKIRVYEVARELGLESKEVLERAIELGIEVKTASSGLDEDAVALVKLSYDDTTTDGSVADASTDETPVDDSGPAAATATAAAESPAEPAEEPTPEPESDERLLIVKPGVTVQELARSFDVRTGDVVKQLMTMGEMVPGGGTVPTHALVPLGKEFGFELLVEEMEEEEEDAGPESFIVEYEDDPSTLRIRPAVVTVMGHVDHGKTKLLDTIRTADVVAGEAGGITQHIGAYQVEKDGTKVTFIDTPGHEAFTALRARGANVTDVAIIVVAADDGVMPQTVEAINHARAAEVPIIIAINKMDLETADPYTVRGALTQHGIVVEDLGGDVVSVEVSAMTGEGVETLLEMIALIAEVEEFKANPSAPAVGTVIESQLEVGRGPVGTVIVQRGTLKRGDAVVAGAIAGRVRAMFDENGNEIKEAPPSTPALVMGWDDVPTAGDMFQVVKNERTARKLAADEVERLRSTELTVPTATERLEHLLEHLRTADHAELRVIVKADAHGSYEAIRDAIAKIKREDAAISILHGGVGGITATDVMLADASDAIIYGFNVRPDAGARAAAKDEGVDIRTFPIIYELLDDVEKLMVGELAPEEVEKFLGTADVRATFRAPRYGMVAGSYVTEGEINRNARARLVRQGVVVYDGKIASLRRFKDDVASVNAGFECGIGLENFRDIKEGDSIESYEVREVART